MGKAIHSYKRTPLPLKQALIIFVRNPEPGKVKTRLAKTMGIEKALRVYIRLLEHTHEITKELTCDRFVFYADAVTETDLWENDRYQKKLQLGNGLGERMRNAFCSVFAEGYETVQIIGSDCYDLTTGFISLGFEKLADHDMVIGPSIDGGYYLLGMQAPFKEVFAHKQWSTGSVFADTMADLQRLSLSCSLLPVLSDIDEEKDISFSRD